MDTKRRSRKSQRGAAALEFAIILPVLMLLVFGMVDFAMTFNAQSTVANAARDGARAASLGKKYAAAGTQIRGETSALLNSSTIAYTICTAATIDATTWSCSGTASGDSTTYDSKAAIDAIVRVTVSYRYSWITPLPGWVGMSNPVTVSQTSYMRIESTS
ncbi:MAG: TadE/TadG family type IV pilus assembly protein [Propionicimonas sp.]|uniref:TadE/TadG family type IV pilus assembly protein n=1 Tax=Propionicimonas sp. TaxID=1955623 RepID=UPI003D0D15EF